MTWMFDRESSVGWLRSQVGTWKHCQAKRVTLVRGVRRLETDNNKLHEILDGWKDSPLKNVINVIVGGDAGESGESAQ